MRIETTEGTLEAQAWHIGRHVAMTSANHYWRFDGKQVADALEALAEGDRVHFEYGKVNMLATPFSFFIHDSYHFNFSSGEEITLSEQGRSDLIAVLQTAMRFDEGLDEMHECEERARYGLPPKS